MLYTYTTNEQNLLINQNINLLINKVLTGKTVTHQADDDEIRLNCPGFYMIEMVGNFAPLVAGDIEIDMNVNGLLYAGAKSAVTSTGPTDFVTINLIAIVQVVPDCGCNRLNIPSIITFKNILADSIAKNVMVTVTKLA